MGQSSILCVAGPMSRSLSGINIFYKAVISAPAAHYDANVLSFEYREDHRENARKAERQSFGIIRSDGGRTPHPPIQRAMDMVVEALTAAGHEGLLVSAVRRLR